MTTKELLYPWSLLRLEDESDFADEDIEIVKNVNISATNFRKSRQKTIAVLREASYELDKVSAVHKKLGISGGTAAIAGSCLGIASGVAAIVFTAGIATVPLLVGGLLWAGVGAGAAGGILKVTGSFYSADQQKKLMEKVRDVIQDDLEKNDELRERIADLEKPAFEDTLFIFNPDMPGLAEAEVLRVRGGLAIASRLLTSFKWLAGRSPLDPAMDLLLKNILEAVHGVSKPTTAGAIAGSASYPSGLVSLSAGSATGMAGSAGSSAPGTAKSAAGSSGFLVRSSTGSASHISTGLNVPGVPGSAGVTVGTASAAEVIAREVVHDVPGLSGPSEQVAMNMAKVAAENALKEGGDDAARIAAKKVTEAVAANATRIAASIGIVFNVAFLVWDIILLVQVANKTSLGEALRGIAQWLEEED